ncbi:hypothetical protein ACFQ1M_18330 [Sungkyunkwania multivorans]|uniref:Uncharacterized protein n=1 Tax=Sungkyunkwania multivorans TaxID=1173618 RepID=A0ABW3D272_9FLAO
MGRERELVMEIQVMGRTFQAEKEILNLVGEEEPKVRNAYFAEKKIEEVEEAAGTHTYTFGSTNDTSTDAQKNKIGGIILNNVNKAEKTNKKYTKLVDVVAKLTANSYKKDDTIEIALFKKEEKISYPKISSAPMGYQVYLIAETRNLKDKKVRIKIHEKEDDLKLLKTKEDILPVLVFDKKEDTTTDTEVSDWIEIDVKEEQGKKESGAIVLHKEDKGDTIEVGMKKIQLRPKEDKIKSKDEDAAKSFEGWQEALYIREDETEEGKKAKKEAKEQKTARDAETFQNLSFDDKATKLTYPEKISGPKTIEVGKEATYTITKYAGTETTEDKNNIRWSMWVQGEDKKSYHVIDTKSKDKLYTYAKVTLEDAIETTDGEGNTTKTGGNNTLVIVFDEALKGKKVQIEPFRGSPDINNKKDYVRTTTVKEVATPIIAERHTTQLWLQTQCDSTENEEETIDQQFNGSLKLTTPDTIHIYSDGKISKLEFGGLTKVKYRYHNDKGDVFDISTCNLFEIDERLKGISNDKKTAHVVESGYDANNIVTYSHASSRKKYSYSDGTIRTYGKFYNPDKGTSYRLVTYKKGDKKVLIVRMPDQLNKKIGNQKVTFTFTKTARRYCGPEHFAGFIGALAEVEYENIKSGGSCEEDGTSYPSVSHINGQSIDTNYLGNNTKDQKFIDAMHNFGFKSILRGSSKKAFNHTGNGGKLHNNHLHSGGFEAKYKEDEDNTL